MSDNNKELIFILFEILHNGFKGEEKHIRGWFSTCDLPHVLGI